MVWATSGLQLLVMIQIIKNVKPKPDGKDGFVLKKAKEAKKKQ